MIAQAWLFSNATQLLAEVEIGGVPAFSWATFVLLMIDGALIFILHQHRRTMQDYASRLKYLEKLSAFYKFTMKQQGIDPDEYVPRESK